MSSGGQEFPGSGDCFFITPLGADDSDTRRRADELGSIIKEVLDEHGLSIVRADNISEPGMVTRQIVHAIMRSRMVFADLTGANANVYYELGVAHTLNRPLVTMIDKARNLTFDAAHDRAVIIGDEGTITLAQARQVRAQLQQFVSSVIQGRYEPRNVVVEAGVTFAVDRLSINDPVLSIVNEMHEDVVTIKSLVEGLGRNDRSAESSDVLLMRRLIERLVVDSPEEVRRLRNALLDGRTSADHDEWLEQLMARLEDDAGVKAQEMFRY
jgi:hypothetical protein